MTYENNLIPEQLSKNYYYWYPGGTSWQRRQNEDEIFSLAKNYLKSIGFEIIENDELEINAFTNFRDEKVKVYFHYQESCNNVYKIFKVYRNDTKSNISLLKKIAKERLNK